MSHLSIYLDQISASCQGIDSLPFPPPKVFTSALLFNNDITSLIRDTEAHERALFSVPQPASRQAETVPVETNETDEVSAKPSRRRQTVFNVAGGEVTTGPPSLRPSAAPRRRTAVAAVLGGDLHAQIMRKGGDGSGGSGPAGGEVDISVLLKGAEKLCSVYALPGALERIPALRQKYAQQSNTLAYYEAKVSEQAQRLEEMNRGWRDGEEEDEDNEEAAAAASLATEATDSDLRREEGEVRELERRKKELQAKLRAMDKDLGGLRNM